MAILDTLGQTKESQALVNGKLNYTFSSVEFLSAGDIIVKTDDVVIASDQYAITFESGRPGNPTITFNTGAFTQGRANVSVEASPEFVLRNDFNTSNTGVNANNEIWRTKQQAKAADAKVLAEANATAAAGDASGLASANAYADTKAGQAYLAAQQWANQQDANHSTADREYTDERDNALASYVIGLMDSKDADHSRDDRAHADTQDENHSTADRNYTDRKISDLDTKVQELIDSGVSQGIYRIYLYMQTTHGDPAPAAPTGATYDGTNFANVPSGWQTGFFTSFNDAAFDYYESFTEYNPKDNSIGGWSTPFVISADTGGVGPIGRPGDPGKKGDPGPIGPQPTLALGTGVAEVESAVLYQSPNLPIGSVITPQSFSTLLGIINNTNAHNYADYATPTTLAAFAHDGNYSVEDITHNGATRRCLVLTMKERLDTYTNIFFYVAAATNSFPVPNHFGAAELSRYLPNTTDGYSIQNMTTQTASNHESFIAFSDGDKKVYIYETGTGSEYLGWVNLDRVAAQKGEDGISPDLNQYSTTAEIDEKDAETLQEANEYTDEKFDSRPSWLKYFDYYFIGEGDTLENALKTNIIGAGVPTLENGATFANGVFDMRADTGGNSKVKIPVVVGSKAAAADFFIVGTGYNFDVVDHEYLFYFNNSSGGLSGILYSDLASDKLFAWRGTVTDGGGAVLEANQWYASAWQVNASSGGESLYTNGAATATNKNTGSNAISSDMWFGGGADTNSNMEGVQRGLSLFIPNAAHARLSTSEKTEANTGAAEWASTNEGDKNLGKILYYTREEVNALADEKDAETLAAAKDYADGLETDLSEYSTTEEVDDKDATTLQAAKDYTDEKETTDSLLVDMKWTVEVQRSNHQSRVATGASIGIFYDATRNTDIVGFVVPDSTTDINDLFLNKKFIFEVPEGLVEFTTDTAGSISFISGGFTSYRYEATMKFGTGVPNTTISNDNYITTLYRVTDDKTLSDYTLLDGSEFSRNPDVNKVQVKNGKIVLGLSDDTEIESAQFLPSPANQPHARVMVTAARNAASEINLTATTSADVTETINALSNAADDDEKIHAQAIRDGTIAEIKLDVATQNKLNTAARDGEGAIESLVYDMKWTAQAKTFDAETIPVSPANVGLSFSGTKARFIFVNNLNKEDIDALVINRRFAIQFASGVIITFSPTSYSKALVLSGHVAHEYNTTFDRTGAVTTDERVTLYRENDDDQVKIAANTADITALKARTVSESKNDVFISPAHTTSGQFVAVKLNGAGTLLVGTAQPTPAGAGAIEYAKMNIAIPIAEWDKCHKVGISTSHATSVMLNLEEFIYKTDLNSTLTMNQLASADGRNSARVRLFLNQDDNEGRSTTTHRLEIAGTVGRVYIGKVRLVNLELV